MTPKEIKNLVKLAFPDYRGRKIRVSADTAPTRLDSYWDGGSRDYWVFVRLHDMEILSAPSNNPVYEAMRPRIMSFLPRGFALIRRSIFCGQEVGVTVWFGNVELLESSEDNHAEQLEYANSLPCFS